MQSVTPPAFFLACPGEPTLSWSKWRKVFQNYTVVCGPNLGMERKIALLLHCLGAEGQEVYEHLPDLDRNVERGLNDYEIALKKLDLHFLPRVSTILERYHFGRRTQMEGESVEEYVSSLRKLAATCKFEESRDERIRDQFLLNCSIDKVREELWLKDDPPLNEVLIVAKQVEHMLSCVHEIKKDSTIKEEVRQVGTEGSDVLIVRKKVYTSEKKRKMTIEGDVSGVGK